MERFRATFFAAASLVPAVFTISALQGAHLAADSSRGARLLETLSCLQCHRINGRGRAVASDLGWRIGRDFTPATLAAAMWNHAPLMWAAMREQSIVPVDLDEQAAADLFAYFYSVRFFEKPGDAERGKAAFGSKGCSKCHGYVQAKRSAAKPVSQWESVSEPIALPSAMWNHGAAMAGDFDKLKLKWPQLTSQDITDLVIYLQGQQAGRHVSVSWRQLPAWRVRHSFTRGAARTAIRKD
jgi:cytochrome c2